MRALLSLGNVIRDRQISLTDLVKYIVDNFGKINTDRYQETQRTSGIIYYYESKHDGSAWYGVELISDKPFDKAIDSNFWLARLLRHLGVIGRITMDDVVCSLTNEFGCCHLDDPEYVAMVDQYSGDRAELDMLRELYYNANARIVNT